MNRQKLATMVGAFSIVCILGLAGILFLKTKSPLVQDPVAARVSKEEEKAKLTDLTIAQWADQEEVEKAPEEHVNAESEETPETASEDYGNFSIDFEKATLEAEKAQDQENARLEETDTQTESENKKDLTPASQTEKGKNRPALSLAQNKKAWVRAKEASPAVSLNEKADSAEKKAQMNSSKAEEGQDKPSADLKQKAKTSREDPSNEGSLLPSQENLKKEGLKADTKSASDPADQEKAAIEEALSKIQEQKKTVAWEEDVFYEGEEKANDSEENLKKPLLSGEEKSRAEGNQEALTDDPFALLAEIRKNEENFSETPSKALAPQSLYTLAHLKQKGVIIWNGYRFTYYSQSVLPGNKLNIPGRHINEAGFVADGSGNIVIAYGGRRGEVIPTPFGYWGKIYDYCETPGTYDCYVK